MKIKGGYILLSRRIDESEVMGMPPATREIWLYILRKVNHKSHNGIERGEGYFSYKQIQEDLCWYIGYRKVTYKKNDIAKALRRLCEGHMVETARTTRGLKIKVLRYNVFQDPKNYERHDEDTAKETRRTQGVSTIHKNANNGNKDTIPAVSPADEFSYREFIDFFNKTVDTRHVGDSKSKTAFKARLKEGFKEEDFKKAVLNASKDEYIMGVNQGKRRYLTPEYITRSDKLDYWLNNESKVKQRRKLN